MRQSLIFVFCLLSATLHAQTTYTVSMAGIAEIKVGMTKAQLEKLLNQPIKLSKLSKNEGYDRDTVHCTYKDLQLDVVLEKQQMENDKTEILVWEVRSSSPQVKTRSGIGIGDDKLKIVSTYEGYLIYIMPEYENNYTTKSKNKSTIWLHGDESGKVIIFYLTDNKVTGMSVTYDEGC